MSLISKQSKRNDLPLSDKILVIKELEKKIPQSVVAKQFVISQSQVSRIWKTKEKLLSAHRNHTNPSRKRARQSTHADIDHALLRWFKQAKSRGLQINGPMLREKAKDLGKLMGVDFDPSNSWIRRWREREGISFKRQQGEKQGYEIPFTSTTGAYKESTSVDDGHGVADVRTNAHTHDEVLQNRQENDDNSSDALHMLPPKNKEVLNALDTIRRRLNSQGMDMDRYFHLEKQLLDSMSKNISQKAIEIYLLKI